MRPSFIAVLVILFSCIRCIADSTNTANVGTLEGSVLKENGGGVWRQIITLSPVNAHLTTETLGKAGFDEVQARTDWDGHYEFRDLPTGKYFAEANDDSGNWETFYYPYRRYFEVTAATRTIQINFVRRKAGYVSGAFRWEDGKRIILDPLDDYNYTFYRKKGSFSAFITSKGAGGDHWGPLSYFFYWWRYKIGKLNPDYPAVLRATLTQPVEDYFVRVDQERGGIPVQPGETTTGVDFTFPRFRSAEDRVSVKGNVILPHQPHFVGTPEVTVLATNPTTHAVIGYNATVSSTATTIPYRLQGLEPGDYDLFASEAAMVFKGRLHIPRVQPITSNIRLATGSQEKEDARRK